MNPLISVSINVSKVTKSKLYEGKQGKYLNITLIPKKTDFGDYMVVEQTTKEERARGERGQIIGNAKLIEPKSSRPAAAEATDDSSSVPF